MSPNYQFEEYVQKQLQKLKNAAGQVLYSHDSYNYKVQIIPDKSISISHFKRDKSKNNRYFAHPQTIIAMRKEIFFMDEAFIDLEISYNCRSCKNDLDLQFWHRCPFCLAEISSHIIKSQNC